MRVSPRLCSLALIVTVSLEVGIYNHHSQETLGDVAGLNFEALRFLEILIDASLKFHTFGWILLLFEVDGMALLAAAFRRRTSSRLFFRPDIAADYWSRARKWAVMKGYPNPDIRNAFTQCHVYV